MPFKQAFNLSYLLPLHLKPKPHSKIDNLVVATTHATRNKDATGVRSSETEGVLFCKQGFPHARHGPQLDMAGGGVIRDYCDLVIE